MTAVGQCFALGGDPRRGLALLQAALPISERADGPTSATVASVLYALAGAELELELFDAAEAHQRRALAIAQGNRTSDVARSNMVAQLGRIVLEQDRVDEAFELHLHAFSRRQNFRPAAPEFVAESQNDLGVVLQLKKDPAGAHNMYRRALQTLDAAGTTTTATYSRYLLDYASCVFRAEDLAGAERVARQALANDEAVIGPDSLGAGNSGGFLGLITTQTIWRGWYSGRRS